MPSKIVSIIGCGWLGLPLAEQLLGAGFTLKGSTTSAQKRAVLIQQSIDAYQLVLNPEPTGKLNALLEADTLVINVPPKAGKMGDGFHPKQIEHLTNAVRQSSIQHVIYVSSTSVYPDPSRTVVEDDVTTETGSGAPMLVRAEQLVQALAADKIVTILRYGGLMGYDRIPGKYVAGKTVDSGEVPVNYLHRDDAVGILQTIIEQQPRGVFNGVSPEHPTREAIYRKSCDDFGYELPVFIKPDVPVLFKVVSPAKLIQATGYAFQYPDPLNFLYEM